MTSTSPYRFRLRLASRQAGRFAFAQAETQVQVSDMVTLEIAARNAETLDAATNFHSDATGFATSDEAKEAAEAPRVRPGLLNAILGLGLNIPVEDNITSQVSDDIKAKLKSEQGATVVDSVWGASVFPDDGYQFEYVFSGNLIVRPSDPSYILEELKTLWGLPISLDEQSEVALQILCLATQETSEKAARGKVV